MRIVFAKGVFTPVLTCRTAPYLSWIPLPVAGVRVPSKTYAFPFQDIRELQLTDNPSFGEDDANSAKSAGNNYDDRSRSPWICPVTSIEMNGKFRFVFDWADGRVLSERAYKMVKEDEATRIFERNMVLMNPESESDVDLMATRMEARKAREKADKKAKKEKRKADDAGFKAPAAPVNGASSSSSGAPATNGESTSAEAKKAKVTEAKKKENPAANGAADKKEKKAGVQSDPTKSEVYKSLFSSHKSAQNKQTGHWVTFDPRYN